MNFSIIIVNYNTSVLTQNCLKSIISCWPKNLWEIIVVDNGSHDDFVDQVTTNFGTDIKLIKNSENLGFARANNQGAQIASGKYLFFLNSDTIIKENILPAIAESFVKNKAIGIVAPKLLNPDGTAQAKAYGPLPTIKYLLYKNLLFQKDNDFPKKIDWVSGAALVIRHDVFNLIGGWDESFFLYLEDVDLCWMAKKRGYGVILNQSISLIHLQGASLKKTGVKRAYYFASQDHLFKKHHGRLAQAALDVIRWPYKTLVLTRKEQ